MISDNKVSLERRKTIITINPDRFSKQSFPPFVFLCKALLAEDYRVKCLSASAHSLIYDTVNFEFISPFRSNTKPLLYGLRFVFFTIFKIIQILLQDRYAEIIVFRSCDSLSQLITASLFRVRLVFFVDYLPWNRASSFSQSVLNPKIFLQVLGLCVAKKIVVPSNFLSEQLKQNIPYLSKKIVVEPYSSELYRETHVDDVKTIRKKVQEKFSKKNSDLVLIPGGYQTRFATESCLRALANLENINIILQINSADSDFIMALAQGLGMLNRIEFLGVDSDILSLIPAADILVLTSVSGYILAAIATDIPVVAADTEEFREWIAFEEFLFKANSVDALHQIIDKILNQPKWAENGKKICKNHLQRFTSNWGERVIREITS